MNAEKEYRSKDVVDDVGDMIDRYDIAGKIYDAIVNEYEIEPTVQQCMEIWHWLRIELDRMISRHVFAVGQSEGWDVED